MAGDERSRFCTVCQKRVYDLSEHTRREAESLLAANSSGLCAQFARRPDGRIVTRDGIRRFALVRKLKPLVSLFVAVLVGLTGCRRTTTLLGAPLPADPDTVDARKPGELRLQPTTAPATQRGDARELQLGNILLPSPEGLQ
ncbi:MAG: hypothetical protein JWM57_2764 [Phycisphaerales bacterium]|nr:hypothetical protein [Phycisphaerales bacterium]